MKTIEFPKTLSNLQTELLKLYALNVSENDLIEIRKLIGNYFANKVVDSIEEFLEKENISTETYNSWENEHYRRKSNS